MADVSDGERHYIAEGIALGIRTDGRSRTDCRPAELELNVVAQAHGSARLHLGATDVLVGVKVELGSPAHTAPDCGTLQVSVECSSCASPEFKGRGGEEWGIELAQALEASILGKPGSGVGLDPATLCIVPGRACWAVYVDGLVLNEGGNVLGALSLAARAALAVARIPKVEVTMAEEGDEPEIEISDDRDSLPLAVAGVPVIVSVSQVGTRCVVDLSAEEEPCASATLHIAISKAGRIAGYTKDGAGGLDPSLMQEMLEQAQELGPSMITSLDRFIAQSNAAAPSS